MYHRMVNEKGDAKEVAEKIRGILTRAVILMVILLAAPILYEALTGGSLNHLAGINILIWETIQWSLLVMVIFVILGLIGVAKCTKDT